MKGLTFFKASSSLLIKLGSQISLFEKSIEKMYCFLRIKSMSGWFLSKFRGAVFNSLPSKTPQTEENSLVLLFV